MDGWPQAEVARLFRVSRSTVSKWGAVGSAKVGQTRSTIVPAAPYAAPARPLGSRKQPSALHAVCLPGDRTASGGSWASLAPPSTPYCAAPWLHRLAWLHRTTREIVRYEHPRPGALVHLDIKKLGRIPQGGGKRILPGFAETRSGPQRGPRLDPHPGLPPSRGKGSGGSAPANTHPRPLSQGEGGLARYATRQVMHGH